MAGSISILDANLLWVFNLLAAILLPPPTIWHSSEYTPAQIRAEGMFVLESSTAPVPCE